MYKNLAEFRYLYDRENFVLAYLQGSADESGLIIEGDISSFKPKTTPLPQEGYLFAYSPRNKQSIGAVENGKTRGYSGRLTIESRLSDIR